MGLTINSKSVRESLLIHWPDQLEILWEDREPQLHLLSGLVPLPVPGSNQPQACHQLGGFRFSHNSHRQINPGTQTGQTWPPRLPVSESGEGEGTTGVPDHPEDRGLEVSQTVWHEPDRVGLIEGRCGGCAGSEDSKEEEEKSRPMSHIHPALRVHSQISGSKQQGERGRERGQERFQGEVKRERPILSCLSNSPPGWRRALWKRRPTGEEGGSQMAVFHVAWRGWWSAFGIYAWRIQLRWGSGIYTVRGREWQVPCLSLSLFFRRVRSRRKVSMRTWDPESRMRKLKSVGHRKGTTLITINYHRLGTVTSCLG